MIQVILKTTCPSCKKSTEITVDKDQFEAWKNGMLIQKAMPDLTSEQREMLISGICAKCWDELFADNDE